jgi:hypothetical protein
VAGQLIGVRLRLLEYERKLKENEELETCINELEDLLTKRKEDKRYGRTG